MAPRNFETDFIPDHPEVEPRQSEAVSSWVSPFHLVEAWKNEMEELSSGKSVNLINTVESDDKVELHMELVGLKSEEIVRIGMTKSNFLEIEVFIGTPDEDIKCNEGNFIWAFPIGEGYKTDTVSNKYFETNKLSIVIHKDPDFKGNNGQDLEDEHQLSDEEVTQDSEWIMDLDDLPCDVQIIHPLNATVEEGEDHFRIRLEIDSFERDELSLKLSNGTLLTIEGNKKDPMKESENQLCRKSFGRMFWIPDGCRRDGITASALRAENSLVLTIDILKGKSPEENPLDTEIEIKNEN